jgi:hypothetical protein
MVDDSGGQLKAGSGSEGVEGIWSRSILRPRIKFRVSRDTGCVEGPD